MAPRKQDHLVDRLASRVGDEVERMSDSLAGKIDATLLDDTQQVPEGQFLEHFRSQWQNPGWRQQMLERMGANGFYEAAMQAFGGTKPEPLGRLVREGQAKGQGLPALPTPETTPALPLPPPPGLPPAYQAMAHNGVARATGYEPPPPQPSPNGTGY